MAKTPGAKSAAAVLHQPALHDGRSLARVHSKRERRRRRLGWSIAALLAAALIVAGLSPRFHPQAQGTSSLNTARVTIIGTGIGDSGNIVSQTLLNLPATSDVSSVAEGAGAAFATDAHRDLLLRFNPVSGAVERTLTLPGQPSTMVLDGTNIWVADATGSSVIEVDATTLAVTRTVAVPAGPSSLAILDDTLWVASQGMRDITPVTMATGAVGTPVPVLSGVVQIASAFNALWVTGTVNRLTKIVPSTSGGASVQSAAIVGQGPTAVAAGAEIMFVANSRSGTVSEVNPNTMQVSKTRNVGGSPTSLAVASNGYVYVGFGSQKRVKVLSLTQVSGTLPITTEAQQLLPVGTGVWVAGANPGQVLSVS